MPFKNEQKGKEYRKKYFQENKERIYTQKYLNRKEYFKTHPWYRSHEAAKSRCNCKNRIGYHRYGGRGIKYKLTLEQVEYLWHRDNADKLDWASLDRINNDGDYEINNCRFIEMRINAKWKNRDAVLIPT